MKTCSGCHRNLSLEEFHRNKSLRDGHETKCKNCRSQIAKDYRERYKAFLLAQTRAYQEANREYFRDYNRRYRASRRATT